MTETIQVTPLERIESRIIVLRGLRVLIDKDIADLYGVTTKRLNEQTKRNGMRFPEDFMFQLTSAEKQEVVAKCDHLSTLKFSPKLPYAFTEHGAIQAANVISSKIAVEMSIQVVRAFIRLRQLVINHKAISSKLTQIENRLGAHDEQIAALLEAIRELATPITPAGRRKIGYHEGNR
jgi:ORF6N domain